MIDMGIKDRRNAMPRGGAAQARAEKRWISPQSHC